jgi:Thymidylate synthase
MRIYSRFPEAFEEIKRDLKEMGVEVHTKTMQNKVIEGDPSYDTIELQNYIYTVTSPQLEDLQPTQPWADAEWLERLDGIQGNPVNPGEAWKFRREVWEEFLVPDMGTQEYEDGFEYTYSERFNYCQQVENVIERLRKDPASRQAYVSMWRPQDSRRLGRMRVPCSLGWLFQVRRDRLDMTYFMRSCDFHTHFQNDVYLACRLQGYIGKEIGYPPGHYTQYMGSLHMYRKDVPDTF